MEQKKIDSFDIEFMQSVIDKNFISDVFHKIKNGLGGIDGFATLLERDLDGDQGKQHLVNKIREGVHKINNIAVGLMLIARDHHLNCQYIQIAPFIKQIWMNIVELESNDIHESKNTKLLIDPELLQNPVYIYTDELLLHKCINSAIDFFHFLPAPLLEIDLLINNKQKIFLAFTIDNSKFGFDMNQPLNDIVNKISQLEAKIALLVLMRLSIILNYPVNLDRKDNDMLIVQFQMERAEPDE